MKDNLFSFGKFGANKPGDLPDTVESLNDVEGMVYEAMKPLGFKKFGRTLHRFVSGDISQVINFQSGMPSGGNAGSFCVNIGIRVPECFDKEFQPSSPAKKYYKEYQCSLRTRLGIISGKHEAWFSLKEPAERLAGDIIEELQNHVVPVFEAWTGREAILEDRGGYRRLFSGGKDFWLFQEIFIYGHLGEMETAKRKFKEYYDHAVAEYEYVFFNGRKTWLMKGTMAYMDQDGTFHTITVEKDGYVTIYDANHRHIEQLEELADKLGFQGLVGRHTPLSAAEERPLKKG